MNQQYKNTALAYLKYVFFFGWSILIFSCYFPSLWKGDFTGLLDYFPYRFFVQCGVIDIFLGCWVVLVTYGIGSLVLDILRLHSGRRNENIFLSFAFGFILISSLTLVLALLGLLYSLLFYLILIVASYLTFRRVRALFSLLNEEVLNFYNEVTTASFWQKAFVIFLLFYFLVLLLVNLINSLGPEIGTDPIVYRLFPLRVYADNHRLISIPELPASFLAKNVEMYFLFGYMLHNEITIKVVNFIFGIILCYAIYSFSDKHFGRTLGLSASALFYSMPIIAWHTHSVLVDIELSFFIFVSIYFIVGWICSDGGRRSLFLSALFCAFAVGIKPYAIINATALCILIFWKLFRMDKNSIKTSFLKASAFGAISAAGYLPWGLINFYFTNNPFYPLMSKYLGGGPPSTGGYKLTVPHLVSYGIIGAPVAFFKALWGINFDSNNYDGIIGPFFVLLLPILALVGVKRLDTTIKYILWFSLISFILWFPFIYSARYMMPLYPALCIAAVYIFHTSLATIYKSRWSFSEIPFKFLTILIILIFAVLNLPFFYNSWQRNPKKYVSSCSAFPISYVLGLESKEKYLERYIRSYPVVNFTNNLSNVKTVFYIDSERPYFYLKHKMISVLTPYVLKFEKLEDPEELLKALKEHDISHIIVEKDTGWFNPQLRRTDGVFANKYLKKIYEKNAVVLYEVLERKKSFVDEYVHYYFLEFLEHTPNASILNPSKEQSKLEDSKAVFEINGDKRFALKILPPTKIQFASTIPPNGFLTFSIGKLFPNVGDGGTFTLDLVDQYGKTHNIFRKTLNPRDNYMDVGWHYNEIDLSQFSGQKVDLIFGSDGSNSLDEIGDWFVWADPQIVVRSKMNFIELFFEASFTPPSCENTPNGKPAFLFHFERGGDTRNTITTIAPSEVSFTINIPTRNSSLIFGLAMPYQLGDGALTEIFFEADGKVKSLYSRYVIPAPKDKHQNNGWIDEIVSLDNFAGKEGKLIFRTSPGPAGDYTADWVGWSEPKIVPVE